MKVFCECFRLDIALFSVTVALTLVSDALGGRELAPIHWNASNPMFKASNNQHIIEVNSYDAVDIICPYYTNGEPSTYEYYAIYLVSEEEYTQCTIFPSSKATLIVNCSAPQRRERFTIIFDPFSAIPYVPAYHEGGTYYYITTSRGDIDGISNDQRGACYTKNMKLTVKVCCETTTPSTNSTTPVTSTGTPQTNTSSSDHLNSVATSSSTATTTTSTTTTTTLSSTTVFKTSSRRATHSPATPTGKPPDKDKTTNDSGENDVTNSKHEGLVNAGSSSPAFHFSFLCYLVLLTCLQHRYLR